MLIHSHKNAKTRSAVGAAILESTESIPTVMAPYGGSYSTVFKWKHREDTADRSHTSHRLQTTQSAGQEELVVYRRTTLLFSLLAMLAVVREFIVPKMARAARGRRLRRRGVSRLRDLVPPEEKAPSEGFKDYEPGCVHIDVKYLPQMKDEVQRR